ncbi:MAG: hypothetical protein HDR00_13065 [Lachnospiraceae bacterium]|nr:hypothetical protein [Lachnospiraceae bacterium]
MNETEKFKKFGGSFFLLLLGAGVGLPFFVSLIIGIVQNDLRLDYFLPLGIVFAIMAWIAIAMMIGYGQFTSFFVKRTFKQVGSLPYQFNSSFRGRNGILMIDVQNGMIGFISAYNPFEIQIFNASRIGKAETIASTMTGVRFVFYLDDRKITMYTLLSNRAVNLKSQMGADAISKADTFVGLLLSAKSRAEGGQR